MSWFKQAKSDYEKQIVKAIKKKIREHPFFINLMKEYHVPEEDLDNHLRIEFQELGNKFAEGNGEEIILDKQLLDKTFLNDHFHYVVHEFFHWIKRRTEALFYFNDDEEIQAFSLAMAWEILSGKSEQEIIKLFYPIVEGHFKDKKRAKCMCQEMLSKAKNIASVFDLKSKY